MESGKARSCFCLQEKTREVAHSRNNSLSRLRKPVTLQDGLPGWHWESSRRMTTGTKSLLFGVHQFIWHPVTVWRGWVHLHKRWPSFWETIAIICHDWGYWGCEKMDDAKGEEHPYFGAELVSKWASLFWGSDCGEYIYYLMLYHSRYLSARNGVEPSKLCWADKLSPKFDPPWFYVLRARLSGEIKEYRLNANNIIPPSVSDREWYLWLQQKCEVDAKQKRKASHRSISQ